MAQRRDARGRFAGSGGGGKIGKSAKNDKARAKYKEAASKLRSVQKDFGPGSPAAGTAFGKKAIAGAKSGLTRVANNLTGKKGKGASTPAAAKPAAEPTAKRSAAKPAASQVAAGRAAKAAYKSKSASKRKSALARKGGSFVETSTFKNSLKPKQAAARQAKAKASNGRKRK
jgi:hypothetical protein